MELALAFGDPAERLEQDLLGDVSCILTVADKPQRQAVHGVLIVGHELREGTLVAGAQGRDEAYFLLGGVRGDAALQCAGIFGAGDHTALLQ